MRSRSRREFFTLLAGLSSAAAVGIRTLYEAAAAGEGEITTVIPIPRKLSLLDQLDPDLFRISGRVTWFDDSKGFGYVAPDKGGSHLLLHVTGLRVSGYQTVREGARIECYALQGPKSPQVYRILHLDGTRATNAPPFPGLTHVAVKPVSGWERATVKWFNHIRGFGFLTRGEGTPDIFVDVETLQRCGFAKLRPGQAADIRWGMGSKGIMVADMRPHWSSFTAPM